MIPSSREELKQYCLERCGAPVITINIAPQQIDNAIDDAMQYWQEYSLDAQERTFYVHQITATDITNRYLTMPDNIFSVLNIYGASPMSSAGMLFNVEYHITADAILGMTQAGSGSGASSYFITKQYLADMNYLFNPDAPFRFRIHNKRLHIDTNWSTRFREGEYVMVECYAIIDPMAWVGIWGDWRLRELAAAMVKRQWGDNLRKFANVPLPSGVVLNGESIYQSAVEEIAQIKDEYIYKFDEPLGFYVG